MGRRVSGWKRRRMGVQGDPHHRHPRPYWATSCSACCSPSSPTFACAGDTAGLRDRRGDTLVPRVLASHGDGRSLGTPRAHVPPPWPCHLLPGAIILSLPLPSATTLDPATLPGVTTVALLSPAGANPLSLLTTPTQVPLARPYCPPS